MLRTPQLLKGPQALVFGLYGLASLVVASPQEAQAVTISFTSAQVPEVCPSGTCLFDVLPTAPITYAQLNSAYPPNPLGYSYNFLNTSLAVQFVNKYQAAAPWASNPANNGNVGFGQIPSSPGGNNPGGPLFFTALTNAEILPGTTLTSATGQYFTSTSSNFSSSQGGTGLLVTAPQQNQVWAVFKCTSGSCKPVPGPLPLLGASAAFAYSRRLRNRVQDSQA